MAPSGFGRTDIGNARIERYCLDVRATVTSARDCFLEPCAPVSRAQGLTFELETPMPQPGFLAVVDDVPPVSEQYVVCLGRPSHVPPLPDDRLLVLDTVDQAALERIAGLDPRLMAAGLVLVTSMREHARDPRAVLRAQKLLACLFVKFVVLPNITTRNPDPMGLRPEETPPEYLHLLNLYRNSPLLLSHCLFDKLRDKAVGMPCLVLLAGPSLQLLKPRLRELSRRYLIVTISRVLPFLRECGVAPDVLVQLDTTPMQQDFHHPDDRYPNSIILSLSLSPISSFASHFRRLFFIDSFNLSILPNPARIRESWLSSLLACLGAAEALHAPQVLLAGADLRLIGEDVYFGDPQSLADAPRHEGPLTGRDGIITFADDQGRLATTTLQLFATAAETELFAQDIHAALGTTFHNLSPWSLLDTRICPPMSLDQASETPELDKTPFLEKADQASAMSEQINLQGLRALYTRDRTVAQQNRDILICLRRDAPEAVRQHPYYRYVAANLPWIRPDGEENLVRMTENLANELIVAARFARNVAALHCRAAKGMTLLILCTAEEESETVARLSRLRPGWSWRCVGIQSLDSRRPQPLSGSRELAVLFDWMRIQEVLIVAPDCARRFHYVLSLVSGENILDLESLLAYAPLC